MGGWQKQRGAFLTFSDTVCESRSRGVNGVWGYLQIHTDTWTANSHSPFNSKSPLNLFLSLPIYSPPPDKQKFHLCFGVSPIQPCKLFVSSRKGN
ncbi:unnamed protein product [Rhodiola kirilowii]